MLACVVEPRPQHTSTSAPLVGPTAASSDDAVVAIVSRRTACGDDSTGLVCTGTLIAPRVVVTAAHCLGGAPPTAFDVVVGPSIAGPRLHVVGGAVHPEYLRDEHPYDIAAFILERDAAVTPRPMREAPLDASLTSEKVRLVGFGVLSGDDMGGGERREGWASVENVDAYELRIVPGPALTCRGDSGGPIFLPTPEGDLLIGVTTWGDPPCASFGMAVRVDRQRAFIKAMVDGAALGPDTRPPFAARPDGCAATCRDDADCPRDTTCVETGKTDVRRCARGGVPPGRYGAACRAGEDCPGGACVTIDEGCFCYAACSEMSAPVPPKPVAIRVGGGGCALARGSALGAHVLWVALALTMLRAHRRGRA